MQMNYTVDESCVPKVLGGWRWKPTQLNMRKSSWTNYFPRRIQGKEVIVKAENGCAVKLVPTPSQKDKPRKPGSARGQIWMADDFDEPLDDFAPYME